MILLMLLIILVGVSSRPEKIRYISTEHPSVTYYNTKYVSYLNATCRRYGRRDPFYYVGINLDTVNECNNNITGNFYFYEFLTNQYKRGFVELHFRLCDLLEKDLIFGPALKKRMPCPLPAGSYNLSNMTIPVKSIPRNFPFTKGRIYINATATDSGELIASAHIDMEIKETRLNQNHE